MHLELLRFNGRMNLISVSTEGDADLIHFSDSLLGGKQILAQSQTEVIYDIGSGNGFPGIIMAILSQERHFCMIDKDARKVEFLKHLISRLGLKNAEAHHKRLEDFPSGHIQCGVSRGFASISKALLASRRVFAVKGEYFHFKGPGWPREIADIPAQVCSFWASRVAGHYELPQGGAELSLVLTKRIG